MKSQWNGIASRIEGFTLVEVLVATMMGAVLLAAVNTLLYGAMRMRNHTEETIRANYPIQPALAMIKKDLMNIVPPEGTLTGTMTGEMQGGFSQRQDTLTFYSSTGDMSSADPWGYVQKIEYSLMKNQNKFQRDEIDLVRSVTRNLLSTVEMTPVNFVLLRNVQMLELSYYDGEAWQTSWDSSTADPTLPTAIQVRLLYIPSYDQNSYSPNNEILNFPLDVSDLNRQKRIPLELMIPITVTPKSSTETTTTEESDTVQESSDQSGDSNTNPGGQSGGNNSGGNNSSGGNSSQGGRSQ